MTPAEEAIVATAIRWHLRLADAAGQDWLAFTAWLEAAPAHALAYDRIATDDLLVPMTMTAGLGTDAATAALAAPAIPAAIAPARPARRRRPPGWAWGLATGGAAAALAALVMVPAARPAGGTRFLVATAPGAPRAIMLADGSRIELNGGTRITLDRADARVALLDEGQAVFHVRHDAASPFEVRAGGVLLRDLGTAFEVTRDGGRLDVQVAAGAVLFRPDREAITLRPGMSLATHDADGRIVLGHVPVANVGAWRSRRLVFSETPLSAVARGIARTTGVRLAVAPALADRLFTGSFRLTGKAERDVAHVAALAGTTYRHEMRGWTITP